MTFIFGFNYSVTKPVSCVTQVSNISQCQIVLGSFKESDVFDSRMGNENAFRDRGLSQIVSTDEKMVNNINVEMRRQVEWEERSLPAVRNIHCVSISFRIIWKTSITFSLFIRVVLLS